MSRKVCRVCFKADWEVYNLFQLAAIDLDGNEVPVHEMLTFCSSIEIALNLPMDICTNCVDACTNAYNFIKQFRKSNDILLESLKSWAPPPQPANVEKENSDDDDSDSFDDSAWFDNFFKTDENSITTDEIHIKSDESSSETDEFNTSTEIEDIEMNNEEFEEEIIENREKFEEEIIENREDQEGESEPIVIQAVTVVREEETEKSPVKLPKKKPKPRNPNKRNVKIEVCSFCGKTYKGSLKYHEEQHTKVPKYDCDICHEKFIAKDKFRYHRIKVHNIGSYLCSVCGQVFHNKTSMRDHTWIHTGIKSYKCDTCGQQFSSPSSLKKHRTRNLCGKRKVYRPTLRPEDKLLQELS